MSPKQGLLTRAREPAAADQPQHQQPCGQDLPSPDRQLHLHKSPQNTALASPPSQTLGLSDGFLEEKDQEIPVKTSCSDMLVTQGMALLCVSEQNRDGQESTHEPILNNRGGRALVPLGRGLSLGHQSGFRGQQGQSVWEQALVSGTDLGKDLSQ